MSKQWNFKKRCHVFSGYLIPSFLIKVTHVKTTWEILKSEKPVRISWQKKVASISIWNTILVFRMELNVCLNKLLKLYLVKGNTSCSTELYFINILLTFFKSIYDIYFWWIKNKYCTKWKLISKFSNSWIDIINDFS